MSAISSYLQTALLNATLRNTAYTSPTSVTVALFTGDPTASGQEISGGNYARQTVTFSAPTGSPATCSNSAQISFPVATANWQSANAQTSITYVAVYDTAGTPNMLYAGALTTAKTINNGDQFVIGAGNLSISLS